jgi:competence protein ComEC
VWGYVLLIGAPDAAARSALLFSVIALARVAGRPLEAEGALAAGYLALAVLDPGAPGRPGVQLAVAGALGLTRFAPQLDRSLARRAPGLPRGLRGAVSAGVGATLASTPIVAWHFERVSLMSVPGTMLAGPLVALAIPGVLLMLLLDPLWGPLSSFVAGGADVVLAALIVVVDACARPAWASVAAPRGWVLAGLVGCAAALLCLAGAAGVGRPVRRLVLSAGAAAAIALAPVARALGDRDTVAIEMLDVGQGDAVLVRTPASRWVLIDTGPRSDGFDAGARRVVPALARRGVRRLELLVLTHPHLDHVGGAPAVLRAVQVAGVLDPGQPQGSAGLLDALDAAQERSVPWTITSAGAVLRLDGLELAILHPSGPPAPPDADPNDVSVVVALRYGAFTALLDGDAPREVEERVAARAGAVDVLKVAHHGSATSSSSAFLERVHPALALVSVGRANGFGHPHPQVLARLQAAGVRVLRTDRVGTIRVRARADGGWTVTTERPD